MNWHVFISYSHKDDLKLSSETYGWVTAFAQDLKVALERVGVTEPKIWMDKKELDGNELFKHTIDEATASSSILVPVISPFYIQDEHKWLKKERDEFIAAAVRAGNLRVGNKSRICPVIKQAVNEKDLPTELADINLKYEFYDENKKPLRDHAYGDRVEEVANTIKNMLENLENLKAPAPAPKRSPRLVYLATATSDVEDRRKQIADELKAIGFEILPSTSQAAPETNPTAIEQDLGRCCLSVHVIGAALKSPSRRAVEIQHQLAVQETERGLMQIVWLPGFLVMDEFMENMDEAEKSFYERLSQTKGELQKFVRGRQEPLLSFIKKTLESIQDRGPLIPGNDLPPGVMPKAYLVCEPLERELLKDVEREFLARDWFVEFPPDTTDEATFTKLHQRHLTDCQAFIIYYGKAESDWVDLQRTDYRAANFVNRRAAPLYSKWIYRGPVETPKKRGYSRKEDYEFEGDFQQAYSKEFIEKVTKARRAPPAKQESAGAAAATAQG